MFLSWVTNVHNTWLIVQLFIWLAGQCALPNLSSTLYHGIHMKKSLSSFLIDYSDVKCVGDSLDRRSHEAYIVYFGGNIVSWRSKKQEMVARSTTEAEYQSLANVVSENWVSKFSCLFNYSVKTWGWWVWLWIWYYTLEKNMWWLITISCVKEFLVTP